MTVEANIQPVTDPWVVSGTTSIRAEQIGREHLGRKVFITQPVSTSDETELRVGGIVRAITHATSGVALTLDLDEDGVTDSYRLALGDQVGLA